MILSAATAAAVVKPVHIEKGCPFTVCQGRYWLWMAFFLMFGMLPYSCSPTAQYANSSSYAFELQILKFTFISLRLVKGVLKGVLSAIVSLGGQRQLYQA